MIIRYFGVVLSIIFLSLPVYAVEVDEMLSDLVLEARARALDSELRCVKCQSETIESSNADWARDARLMVRELIQNGATDEQVLETFVQAYGEPVLMRPNAKGANLLLWLAAPLLLILGLFAGMKYVSGFRGENTASLSEDEVKRVQEILER